MTDTGERDESTAEREGIVDQQNAAIERSAEAEADRVPRQGSGSTAEREGIVDQQDAVLEDMDEAELDVEVEAELEQVQDSQEAG